MISLSAVWAIALRHLQLPRRDPNYLLGHFYWPILDILTWGFLGTWLQQSQTAQFQNYEAIAVLGVVLWSIVGRGSNIIIVAFSEEIWIRNLVNLFALPLRLRDWICGASLFFMLMITMIAAVCLLVAYSLYNVAWWDLLKAYLLFAPPLALCAIWLGFTCLQIITLFGRRGIELGFVIGWMLLPFSGAYYPINVLPVWGQAISKFVPMSYIFQALRGYLGQQQSPVVNLLKGTSLALLYAAVAISLFVYCFNRSKRRGLASLAE